MLAMHWRGDAFTAEQKARNFAYYERPYGARLVPVGLHPGRARGRGRATSSWPTTTSRETALMDLRDLNHNTRDGVHIASLAGAWIAPGRRARRPARPRRPALVRAPPAEPDRPAGVLCPLATVVPAVVVTPDEATYSLRDGGSSVTITHHGEPLTLGRHPGGPRDSRRRSRSPPRPASPPAAPPCRQSAPARRPPVPRRRGPRRLRGTPSDCFSGRAAALRRSAGHESAPVSTRELMIPRSSGRSISGAASGESRWSLQVICHGRLLASGRRGAVVEPRGGAGRSCEPSGCCPLTSVATRGPVNGDLGSDPRQCM